ncbi:hypothetical protein RR46_13835 [Papilio xuthus]|uniref:Cilia- and flagella-associated protein 61 N-terminal domain-containing protein n=1 Tax=Papilio xuthus TaxID=66420 RepID=A0A194PIS2_PAPXU|nr:hypothetical protein RR46_13835 [Papilio xuthus]
MSIYFNFDVGPTGRRFRRAIDGDKADIEYLINKTYGEIYGGADIGTLIELSTLSICMIDVNKDVIGFMALGDHPNVPGVSQVDWEIWMRNMFQEEDNDDIVEILDKKCPQLKELYGEYYISEIISRHPSMKRKVIVAAVSKYE